MLQARYRRLLPINLYAFSLSFHTSALLTIVVPAALLRLDPAHHTLVLSRLAAIGAIFAMILPPVIGHWSDRVRQMGGRRRSFVMAGGVINAIGLIGMFEVHTLPLYTSCLFLSLLGQGGTQSGYQALWSDLVKKEDRGASAGIQGALTLLGNICGLGCAGILGGQKVVLIMAAVMFCGMLVTIWLVPEATMARISTPSDQPQPRPEATSHRNFSFVFLSQAFVAFGMSLLMTFVLYFFRDDLHVKNASGGTASVAILALGGAVVSSIVMGRISDTGIRRLMVAASGAPMALAAIGFALLQRQDLLWIFALLFGLGYGAFLSTGWALTVDTLPDQQNVARDLGIWNVASTFPTVLAPLAGGVVLSMYATSPAAGYKVMFVISGLFLAAGGAVILRVGSKVKSSVLSVPLRLFVAAVVYGYLRLMYTIRVHGRLPLRRPGTLVVSNHLHDLDGMIIPAWLTLQGPWRHPVRYAAATRLLEPGFMAVRFPFLRDLLHRLNMGPFFRVMGVLPIENQPLVRPLASFAYEILAIWGNLPVVDVFTEEVNERLQPRPTDRLRKLWGHRMAEQAQANGSIRDLKEPYRSWMMARQRQLLEDQLRVLKDAVAGGDTLYIAPEGRYSADGRLGRFRLAYDVLHDASALNYIVGLSYDVLSKRRRRIYLNIAPAIDGIPVEQQVCALRPITVGHLLANWLVTSAPTEFTAADAIRVVEARAAVLPGTTKLAVGSRWQRVRIVRQSLRSMTRLGVLESDGQRFRLGTVRTSDFFPLAEDILQHQNNALLETVAAVIEIENHCRQQDHLANPIPSA